MHVWSTAKKTAVDMLLKYSRASRMVCIIHKWSLKIYLLQRRTSNVRKSCICDEQLHTVVMEFDSFHLYGVCVILLCYLCMCRTTAGSQTRREGKWSCVLWRCLLPPNPGMYTVPTYRIPYLKRTWMILRMIQSSQSLACSSKETPKCTKLCPLLIWYSLPPIRG